MSTNFFNTILLSEKPTLTNKIHKFGNCERGDPPRTAAREEKPSPSGNDCFYALWVWRVQWKPLAAKLGLVFVLPQMGLVPFEKSLKYVIKSSDVELLEFTCELNWGDF